MFAHGEAVTILFAKTTVDPYSGDEVASWDDPLSFTVYGVAVEPRPSGEPVQDARNAVTSGYTLYFPAHTEISSADRVEVRGEVFDVKGDPAAWVNPFTGWFPGVIVQCERTAG